MPIVFSNNHCMNRSNRLFFQLLRFALGTEPDCPKMTVNEWKLMFKICTEQCVVAFVGDALNRAKDVLADPTPGARTEFSHLILEWMGNVLRCKRMNIKINQDCIGVSRAFQKEGFDTCILKGQGNASLYPNPFSRMPGDIDIWVRSMKQGMGMDEMVRDIIAFVRKKDEMAEIAYHHVECPPYKGTPVEVHYRPQFLFSFLHNRRLQRYFSCHADVQFSHSISLGEGVVTVPTAEFNMVFQLSHIFNHLFHEGIGMRQLIDYYFVMQHLTDEERHQNWEEIFKPLGLYGMLRAMMWIFTEVFGMEPKLCLVTPDERRGRFVLNEIMIGGNFGKFDHRNRFGHGAMGRNLQRLCRDARLLRFSPSEAIAEPFFRVWHFFWRWRH